MFNDLIAVIGFTAISGLSLETKLVRESLITSLGYRLGLLREGGGTHV